MQSFGCIMKPMDDDLDDVFKALADPYRRRLLDRLHVQNGQTLGMLCAQMEMSRQGVAKHLDLLEAASLVVTLRRGREKLHYLNPAPIQAVAERWLHKFEAGRSNALAELKKSLEEGRSMPDMNLTTESTVYALYVGAAPAKVWEALTSSEFTPKYFFGRRAESEWTAGSAWLLRRPDGAVDVEGVVRESDPPRRLVLTWRAVGMVAMKELPVAVVTYEIEPVGDEAVRLTMTEAHPTPIPAFLLEGGRRGWPMILSGLKTLLETGRPLELQTPEPPRKD